MENKRSQSLRSQIKLPDSPDPMKKKEKQDLLSRFWNMLTGFFEKKQYRIRLWVTLGIAGFVLILVISWLVWWQWQKSDLSHQYYRANIDFFERIEELKNQKILGINVSDDEIAKLADPYHQILQAPIDTIETFLSQYQLGMLYYSVQDYEKATQFFQLAYENKDQFILSSQALLNLGHAFFNLADTQADAKQFDKALQTYQLGLDSYLKLQKELKTSPYYVLSLKYVGMLNENLAVVYKKQGKIQHAQRVLKDAENSYLKLKSVKITETLSSYFIYRHPSEDADLGLIRVRSHLTENARP